MLAPTLSRVPAQTTPSPTLPRSPRRSPRPCSRAVAGALAATVAAALLASCSTAPPTLSEGALDPDTLIDPAWQVEADIVGGSAATGDGVVAYERVEGGLAISAWSLDGKRLWSEPADPGWMHENDDLQVRAFERDGEWRVAHLSTSAAGSALRSVIVRDVASGDIVGGAPGVLALTAPAPCDDDAAALCLVGWDTERRYAPAVTLRFDADARAWVPDPDRAQPEGTERLTDRVFHRGEGPASTIGHFAAGVPLWESRILDLSGIPGLEGGHGIREDADGAPTLLWFAGQYGEDRTRPLTDQAVLAVDPTTGEPLWRESGAGLCGALAHPLVNDPAVVCRYRSGIEHDRDHGTFVTGVEMSMAGVDLATGDELWSVEVDGHSSHVMWTEGRHSAPAGFATVHIGGGLHRLDLRTGETEELDEDAVFACDLELGEVELEGSGLQLSYDAGSVTLPCDAAGDRVERWSVGAVRSVAWQADDTTAIVRTKEGLAAFTLPAEGDEGEEQEAGRDEET